MLSVGVYLHDGFERLSELAVSPFRIKELECALESEREGRCKVEKELDGVTEQLDILNETIEETRDITSAQNDLVRQKDLEIVALKEQLVRTSAELDAASENLKKRNHEINSQLTEELEQTNRLKIKLEREKSQMTTEIKSINGLLDDAKKVKTQTESKLIKQEDQVKKLRTQVDEVNRKNQELNGLKSRIDQENVALKQQVSQLDKANSELTETQMHLQKQLDETNQQNQEMNGLKTRIDHENITLQQQVHQLDKANSELTETKIQIHKQLDEINQQNQELNGLKTRIDHENITLQQQVQGLDKANTDLTKIKTRLQKQLDEIQIQLDDETKDKELLSAKVSELQVEVDKLCLRLETESESNEHFRVQLLKSQTDLKHLQSLYQTDIKVLEDKLEYTKKKMLTQFIEQGDNFEQAKSKAIKVEKERNKLLIQIQEITAELETANSNAFELAKQVKQLKQMKQQISQNNSAEKGSGEGGGVNLQKVVEDLTWEINNSAIDKQHLSREMERLGTDVKSLETKLDEMNHENTRLSDSLRNAVSKNKEFDFEVEELNNSRAQLHAEKDRLTEELAEATDTLTSLKTNLDAANSNLSQTKLELEKQLKIVKEKEDELENSRKSSRRTVEDLQTGIVELDAKHKADANKLKKKFENEMIECAVQLETLTKANAELSKSNKILTCKIKEFEFAMEEQRHETGETQQEAALLERKRIALQKELDDVRSALETAERARKKAEHDLTDYNLRIGELTATITNMTAERRRLEGDLASVRQEFDEAVTARHETEDKSSRSQQEVNRLTEELRQEQESYKNAEAQRRLVESEMRQVSVRLEQAESVGQKEGRRLADRIQAKLRDAEAELGVEQRRSRDLAGENRRLQRVMQEQKVQWDEDRRLATEQSEQVNTLANRIKAFKRQLDEAEEVVTVTMKKYRKAQQMVEEYERQNAEKSIHGPVAGAVNSHFVRSTRSMSVTRETCGISKL